MQYAILGDIHSSKEDLEEVLRQISNEAPGAIRIGTGDIFECTISKKDVTAHKFTNLKDVMILPDGFVDLLTFVSVRGNQEERILLLTETDEQLREKLAIMPETYEVGRAEIIHGHQWEWGGEPWDLMQAETSAPITFYGHSHRSSWTMDGVLQEVEFGKAYELNKSNILVNVGAVIGNREWVLYDAEGETLTFMKA
ncbi:metallophosphoesterase [Sporosarcina sp. HYO08]|uniref:metallophosphoesterase family protein n=1 Tax=Sporosarcina sp. HYO08 TaxID=1759557 RepID=UPI000791FBD7|nr:metallophosphoesterase family protein [Sporosarcina sp. HYO08]KXH81969.1 hypothetical protein AU377_06840 [Sporosarcina sp. HYO08]